MSCKIQIGRQALKFLERQSLAQRTRILRAIGLLPNGDVKPIAGWRGKFRLRVGGFRVIYEFSDGMIKVEKIGNRGDVYK